MKVNVVIFLVVFCATLASTYVRGSEPTSDSRRGEFKAKLDREPTRSPASVLDIQHVPQDLPTEPSWAKDTHVPTSEVRERKPSSIVNVEISQDHNPQFNAGHAAP